MVTPTISPLFSVRKVATPLRTCCRPILTASPRRPAGVTEDVEPNPLAGSDRPARLIGLGVLLGPFGEAWTFFPLRIFHAGRRIGLDLLRFERSAEQATHGVQEIARLCGGS